MTRQFFAVKQEVKTGLILEVVKLAAENKSDAYDEINNMDAGLRETNPDLTFREVSFICGW
jgi:hypothetical protein